MNKKVILFLIVLLCFINVGSADTWINNSSIVSGLGDIGSFSKPNIFNDNNTLKMISGESGTDLWNGFYWNGLSWVSDSSIINGLSGGGWAVKPSVYNNSGTFELISSDNDGDFIGFQWNGSSWISNSSLVNGLEYISELGFLPKAIPNVYIDNGTRKLLVGTGTYGFHGFYWNGSSWVNDSSIISGLGGLNDGRAPAIYNDSVLKLICGFDTGDFHGFYWNGSSWVNDSSIISGLGDIGSNSHPTIFKHLNIWKLISGNGDGTFNGFQYTQNLPTIPTLFTDLGNNLIDHTPTITWTKGTDPDGDAVTTYIYVGTTSTPTTLDSTTSAETVDLGVNTTLSNGMTYYYRLRSWDGYEFSSYTIADEFRMNTPPIIPTSFTDLGNNLIDHTPTITWTKGTDADSDIVTTYIYVGTTSTPTDEEGWTTLETFNLGTNITLTDGTTYYYRLRSWDGYEFSNYTTSDEFKMNNKPVISNTTISPDPTAVEDDLTALNDTATDADGDPVTLYYRWYKNSVHQSDLTTSIVNSTNTSNGELWKVGIIPNDGYENGTEVQSQAVEIGSSNSAPTATGASINISYPIKRYVNFSITGLNGSDPNGDQCRIEVGSSTGLFDLGVSGYINASLANVTIAMPYYDGLEHTLYVRLNDSNLTSQEYLITITSDITPPILNSESRSPATGTQGASFGITINTTSINTTIKTVTVSVSRPDATTANWSMSNTVNDTWYYSYTSTSDIGTYTINSYTITDASDNTDTINSALSFTITAAVVTEGGGGGGGGGTTIIQVGDISDLTLTPPRLDTYALYGGFGEDRILKYRFIANRNVTSCTVEPTEEHNGVATCEITDGYIVDVYLTINDSRGYSGTLTVRDSDEFVATSDLIVRVIDIGAHIKIVNIPVGEAIASSLNLFFASANGVLIGIRAWSVGATIGLLGLYLFKSDIFE